MEGGNPSAFLSQRIQNGGGQEAASVEDDFGCPIDAGPGESRGGSSDLAVWEAKENRIGMARCRRVIGQGFSLADDPPAFSGGSKMAAGQGANPVPFSG